MDKEIDLKMAIQEAYLYFGQEPEISIERHIDLLRRIFKDNGAEPVIRGIRNGMSGKYGYIQPKLNLHLMSIWIRCAIQGCKPNDLKYSKDRL